MTETSIDEDDLYAPPSSSSSSWEIDSAYEFDASQFFDFSRPESSSDAEQAERWFQVAGYYPPSHFYFKAKVKTIIPANDDDDHLSSSSNNPEKTTKGGRRKWNNGGQEIIIEDDSTPSKVIKPKEKNVIIKLVDNNNNYKQRSSGGGGGSTLMKPTASQLAKVNHAKQHRHNNEAVKRQKLDSGYYVSKGGSSSSPAAKTSHRSKLNITVPREPHLETQCRAQWRRFKSKNELSSICSSDSVRKEKSSAPKLRPLNQKVALIQQALPSTPQTKKSIRQSPTSQKSKFSDAKKLLQDPPIELFSKLTLNSDMDNRAASHQKPHPFGHTCEFKQVQSQKMK